MRVKVEVLCAPKPREEIESALRGTGKRLASREDSVTVEVHPTDPPTELRIAVLEFEIRRAAQYKAVDEIYEAVKLGAWAFYEDITIWFPKDRRD
jgi:hypothetical protein